MGSTEAALEFNPSLQEHVFSVDRDSTLVPGVGHDLPEDELLNKKEMGPLIKKIISGGHPWAIISTGNVDGVETNAHHAIKKIADYSKNSPVNPSISKGMEGVLNAIPGIHASYGTQLLKEQLNPLGIKFGGKSIDALTEQELVDCMSVVQYGTYQYSEETQTHSLILKERSGKVIGEVTIDPDTTFEIQFGETTLTINSLKWMQANPLHVNGDNKFFQSLKAFDELHLKLEITPDIERLGVMAIKAPQTYRSVHPSNVTMLDDKQGVCDLMSSAGFCAILADTPEKRTKQQESNTYLKKFSDRVNQLPQSASNNTNALGWAMVASGLAAIALGTGLAASGVGAFIGLGIALAGVAAVIGGIALLLKNAKASQVVSNEATSLPPKKSK